MVALTLILVSFGYARALRPNPDCNDRDIKAGEILTVEKNCRVHGDVYVGRTGTHKFKIEPDADENSGMVVMCLARCRVYFPFGGGVTGQLVESIARDLSRTGCDANGCSRIDLRVFPG